MNEQIWYLAGPMTGIPQFNFPLFDRAASDLRNNHDMKIISPAELDDDAGIRDKALASEDGQLKSAHIDETWGDLLARDVKLIADVCTGVVFLPDWHKSRGARLEAYVGILCGHDFARYVPGSGIEALSKHAVLTKLSRQTHNEIRHG